MPIAPSAAPPIPYGVLKQRHPEYDEKRLRRIEDLYEGGWAIQSRAKDYLPRHLLEHPQRHTARCETASYQPYFGQIVDQFVADLFTQPLNITPAGDAKNPNTPGSYPDETFYSALAKNIDGDGTELVSLAADVLTTALKHRHAYVMVDAPDVGDVAAKPESLAEEDAIGARRCYAYEVPPAQVIDWHTDAKGAFSWVMLATSEQERETPTGARDTIRETYTLWTATPGGVAAWVRYVVNYKAAERPPAPDAVIEAAAAGTTNFPRIPLLRLELSPGLWVGNKIGTQALEHWRRRSELIGAEAISCVAIPYATLGPEMPAMGQMNSEAQQDPDRARDPVRQFEAKGFLALGQDDAIEFAEPEGKAYEIIDKQLDALREGMYAVNHQMAASIRPTGAALGRSGLSKQKDTESTAKVLGALGRIVRAFFTRLYDTVSAARGEKIVWVAHGLDSYETEDRQQVLDESIQLQAVDVPSPTFRKEHAKRIASKLVPGLQPATVAQINQEIDDGVDQGEELRQAEHDAAVDEVKNPPPPVVAGAAPPS